jgi:hypothetical protein
MQQISTAGQWYLTLGWPMARQGQGMLVHVVDDVKRCCKD